MRAHSSSNRYPRSFPALLLAGFLVVVLPLAAALLWSAWNIERLADRGMRNGEWLHSELRPQCSQLRGKTVGIVGLGNIGKMVARKLRGFETRVLYYDPVRPGAALERELEVEYVTFDALLAKPRPRPSTAPATWVSRSSCRPAPASSCFCL